MSDFEEADDWKTERLRRAVKTQTVAAMIQRYADRGQPIDVEGYIVGEAEE